MKTNETYKTIEQVRTVLRNLKKGILSDFRNYEEPEIIKYLDNMIAEGDNALNCCF